MGLCTVNEAFVLVGDLAVKMRGWFGGLCTVNERLDGLTITDRENILTM